MSLIYYTEEEEDYNKEESIDKYKDIFIEYENNLPTLSDSLNQMFISYGADKKKSDELIEDILSKCKSTIDENLKEINEKYDKVRQEDAYIICSYTCEAKDVNYSPYRILNRNLVSKNRKNGLSNISKYLYLFLKTLRKLKIYLPSEEHKYLYRCITHKVGLTEDPFDKKYIPYKIGNTKTFWGFTSTSPNVKTTYNFLKDETKNKSGTIFVLGGDIWGYDITLFNYFKEEEILLEPERKFLIDNVLPPLNDIININCKVLKTPLVLDNKNITCNNINNNNISNNNTTNNNIREKTEDLFDNEINNEEKIKNQINTKCICKI